MLAIYRKYRPQKLADVLGQESVTQILHGAAIQDRLAHAYLFYGPRGSGKTTTARIIAKIANCLTRASDEGFRATGEPCNTCSSCKEIDEGRALDVVEIDAASNRGIDEIRDLKENVKFAPSRLRCKIFIIDEAHQLTKEAFNALLKTLEEPPAHAIFILATTDFDRMPATIVSRSQRFHFRRLPLKTIVEKLKEIARLEKIEADSDALELIAVAAEGSLRDAESLLDQITSLENKVTLESVESSLGRVGFRRTSEFAGLILAKDLSKALDYLFKISEDGHNIVQFNKDLIQYFRRVLALQVSPELEADYRLELADKELETLKKHSAAIDPRQTILFLKSLIRAQSEMRYSPFPHIPLEVAIIENLRAKTKTD